MEHTKCETRYDTLPAGVLTRILACCGRAHGGVTARLYCVMALTCARWHAAIKHARLKLISPLVAVIEEYSSDFMDADWEAIAYNPAVDLRIYMRWRAELRPHLPHMIAWSAFAADFVRMRVDGAHKMRVGILDKKVAAGAHIHSLGPAGIITARDILTRYGSLRASVYDCHWQHTYDDGKGPWTHRLHKFYNVLCQMPYAEICKLNDMATAADVAYLYGINAGSSTPHLYNHAAGLPLQFICPICVQWVRDIPLEVILQTRAQIGEYRPRRLMPINTCTWMNCNITLEFILETSKMSSAAFYVVQNRAVTADVICAAKGHAHDNVIVQHAPLHTLRVLWPNGEWKRIRASNGVPAVLLNPRCTFAIAREYIDRVFAQGEMHPNADAAHPNAAVRHHNARELVRSILRIIGSGFVQHPDKIASW